MKYLIYRKLEGSFFALRGGCTRDFWKAKMYEPEEASALVRHDASLSQIDMKTIIERMHEELSLTLEKAGLLAAMIEAANT